MRRRRPPDERQRPRALRARSPPREPKNLALRRRRRRRDEGGADRFDVLLAERRRRCDAFDQTRETRNLDDLHSANFLPDGDESPREAKHRVHGNGSSERALYAIRDSECLDTAVLDEVPPREAGIHEETLIRSGHATAVVARQTPFGPITT